MLRKRRDFFLTFHRFSTGNLLSNKVIIWVNWTVKYTKTSTTHFQIFFRMKNQQKSIVSGHGMAGVKQHLTEPTMVILTAALNLIYAMTNDLLHRCSRTLCRLLISSITRYVLIASLKHNSPLCRAMCSHCKQKRKAKCRL